MVNDQGIYLNVTVTCIAFIKGCGSDQPVSEPQSINAME